MCECFNVTEGGEFTSMQNGKLYKVKTETARRDLSIIPFEDGECVVATAFRRNKKGFGGKCEVCRCQVAGTITEIT